MTPGDRGKTALFSVYMRKPSAPDSIMHWEARGIFTEPLRQPRDRSAQSTKNAKLGGKAEGEDTAPSNPARLGFEAVTYS